MSVPKTQRSNHNDCYYTSVHFPKLSFLVKDKRGSRHLFHVWSKGTNIPNKHLREKGKEGGMRPSTQVISSSPTQTQYYSLNTITELQHIHLTLSYPSLYIYGSPSKLHTIVLVFLYIKRRREKVGKMYVRYLNISLFEKQFLFSRPWEPQEASL